MHSELRLLIERIAYNEYWFGKFYKTLWTFWYRGRNQMKRIEGHYVDGKQAGLWTRWYSNGAKREEGQYKEHLKTGIHTLWYRNGKKRSEGQYEYGKKTGLWTFWNPDGNMRRTITYGKSL